MADDADDGVLWVRKDAFVMPLLPPDLGVDPLVAALLHVTAFLELSGDDTVDPDWAVEALEHVGHYLEQLPPDRIEAVREQLGRVRKFARKNKWGKDAVEFFAEYLENVGLGVDE